MRFCWVCFCVCINNKYNVSNVVSSHIVVWYILFNEKYYFALMLLVKGFVRFLLMTGIRTRRHWKHIWFWTATITRFKLQQFTTWRWGLCKRTTISTTPSPDDTSQHPFIPYGASFETSTRCHQPSLHAERTKQWFRRGPWINSSVLIQVCNRCPLQVNTSIILNQPSASSLWMFLAMYVS